jgi:hypothetical protein
MKDEKTIELEITIKEKTGWGLVSKTFSDNKLRDNRALTIVQLIEYLSKNFHEDYIKAVKILRGKK